MHGHGIELPRRTTMAYVLVGTAAVLALPCIGAARAAASASGSTAAAGWSMAVAMVLLLVLAPLLLARSILVRRTWVSHASVTVERGGRPHHEVAFSDLTEVQVRVSGNGGTALRNEKVFLIGPPRTGRGIGVLVSRFHVETLQPLLARLALEVEGRPELLASELERDYFTEALQSAR